jgi:hypothetical protein
MLLRMRDVVRLIVWMVLDLFRSRAALEAEILTLRQQINVVRRAASERQTFSAIDRLIFVRLYRLRPGVRDALAIVKPETVVPVGNSILLATDIESGDAPALCQRSVA